jgi:hypothetical protein
MRRGALWGVYRPEPLPVKRCNTGWRSARSESLPVSNDESALSLRCHAPEAQFCSYVRSRRRASMANRARPVRRQA